VAAAQPAATLPVDGLHAYEPKLDGWRLVAHTPAGVLHTRKAAEVTARFPEILAAARRLGGPVVLDGELVAYRREHLDFAPLMWSPRRRAAEGVAVYFVAFDLIAHRGRDLRYLPYEERRDRLAKVIGAGSELVQLMDSTTDPDKGAGWISPECAALGIEGAVAKPLHNRYPLKGGACGWVKVKYHTTMDAVVLGVTGNIESPTTLVLGQLGDDGHAHIFGLSSALPRRIRSALKGRLQPEGRRRQVAGIVAGLPGLEEFDYQPVAPGLVVEVQADSAQEWGRFRHRLSLLRVRPPDVGAELSKRDGPRSGGPVGPPGS
jgi:ATP-dependent DNA ligase